MRAIKKVKYQTGDLILRKIGGSILLVTSKLQQTVVAIVEEFFEANGENVMLYLCETGDGKQKFRNRLFLGWFNTYAHRAQYEVRTAEGKMDGIDNFAALFIKISNPRYRDVIDEFEEITSILFD